MGKEREIMSKAKILLLIVLATSFMLYGCGAKKETGKIEEVEEVEEVVEETEEEKPVEENREGMYRSELTNEWIDESLQSQRPIAVMVDNESIALPHYGLSKADIVYEITNSTANEGITRFMVLVKDWANIKQLGSVRSARTTNFQILPEWNAVLCHDGGPFYIDAYLKNDYVENFNGTFSRVDNGKPREYTEYILPGDLEKNFENKGYSITYNEYYPGTHFIFASDAEPVDLTERTDSIDCTHIELPFKHNDPYLDYNEEDGQYYYSEYGKAHVDPGNDNAQMAFKNLLIQNTTYEEYDDNGYMGFHVIDSGRTGYYITGGKAIPVTWAKETDITQTTYYDMDGNEIVINTGKTYIAIVPDDEWEDMVIE